MIGTGAGFKQGMFVIRTSTVFFSRKIQQNKECCMGVNCNGPWQTFSSASEGQVGAQADVFVREGGRTYLLHMCFLDYHLIMIGFSLKAQEKLWKIDGI